MDLPFDFLGSRLWACCFSLFDFLSGFVPHSVEMLFRRLYYLMVVTTCTSLTLSAPPGFPSSGNGLWYTSPGAIWAQELLPVGNGYLAGMCWPYLSTLSLKLIRAQRCSLVALHRSQLSLTLNLSGLGDLSKTRYVEPAFVRSNRLTMAGLHTAVVQWR